MKKYQYAINERVMVWDGKHHSIEFYYEFEIKPSVKPSLLKRLLRKDVYLYA